MIGVVTIENCCGVGFLFYIFMFFLFFLNIFISVGIKNIFFSKEIPAKFREKMMIYGSDCLDVL